MATKMTLADLEDCFITGLEVESRYIRDRKLGEGAYGAVFRYLHRDGVSDCGNFPQEIAIKEVKNDALSTREIENMRRLCHRNVIKYYGHYSTGPNADRLAIVMESCQGSLRDILRCRTLKIYEVSRVMGQVLEGLGYLHDENIIHRDIKPDNILLSSPNADMASWKHVNTSELTFKLADFGQSRHLTSAGANKSLSAVGTLDYMAPEVRRGIAENALSSASAKYGKPADIWSLGCLAHFCFTGRLPEEEFTGEDIEGLESFKNFLKHQIRIDPASRSSARVLKEHSFIRDKILSIEDVPSLVATNDLVGLQDALKECHSEEIGRELEKRFGVVCLIDEASKQGSYECAKLLLCLHPKIDMSRSEALSSVVESGNLAFARHLVKNTNIDLNLVGASGHTPLGLAVTQNNLDMAHFLSGCQGADTTKVNLFGNTLLHAAVLSRTHREFVRSVIHRDRDGEMINRKNSEGRTPLLEACQRDFVDLDTVKMLIKEGGADVGSRDGKGRTAFLAACGQKGSVRIVQYLIENGLSSPDERDDDGSTALHIASACGHEPTVRFLLENTSVDPKAQDYKGGSTALHLACENNHATVVECFLDMESSLALINAVNAIDQTAFHVACLKGSMDVVALLMNNVGSSENKLEQNGITFASMSGHLDVLKFLVQKGMKPKPDSFSRTCLHYACLEGHLKLARYVLVKNLAAVDAPDVEGKTALHFASGRGWIDIVKYLSEKARAKIELRSLDGSAASELAAKNGHMEIATYLASKESERGAEYASSMRQPKKVSRLLVACDFGDLPLVKHLLEEQFDDAMETDSDGNLCLHRACRAGHVEVVKYLIEERKMNPSGTNKNGETALHVAAGSNQVNIVKYLLVNNLVEKCDEVHGPILHFACAKGTLDVVKYLIERADLDPEEQDRQGHTPLMISSRCRRLGIVKYLIREVSVDCSRTSNFGANILHIACSHGYLELVKYLVEQKIFDGKELTKPRTLLIDGHKRQSIGNKTPIIFAALGGHLEVARYLVERAQVDLDGRDIDGNSVLTVACMENHLHMMMYFIEDLALDPKEHHLKGESLLHQACTHNSLSVAKYLIKKCGFDPSEKSLEGYDCLFFATFFGHVEVVKYLIEECKINPDEQLALSSPRSDAGMLRQTSEFFKAKVDGYLDYLSFSCLNGNLEMVRYLTEKAKLRPTNQLPLKLAISEGHLMVVTYLVEEKLVEVTAECLDDACDAGHLDLFIYFVEKAGLTVNARTLLRACHEGHLDIVKYLIEDKGVEATRTDDRGRGSLHMACANGRLDMVRYFVQDLGVDPNARAGDESAPLHVAARFGHVNVVRYLRAHPRTDVALENGNGENALQIAAWHSRLDVLMYLLSNTDLGPNSLGVSGVPLIGELSAKGHLGAIRYLVEEKNVDPSQKFDGGKQSLHVACEHGHEEIVKYFVTTASIDPNQGDDNGWTALHTACIYGHVEIAKFLAKHPHTNLLAKTGGQHTSFICAVLNGNLPIVRYMMEECSIDPECRQALPLACAAGHADVAEYLIDKGIFDFEYWTSEGKDTPLHWASRGGHLDAIKLLVSKTAFDVNAKGQDEKTPLLVASAKGHLDIVRYLIENLGADLSCVEPEHGFNSLHRSTIQGHYGVTKYLVEEAKLDPGLKDNYDETPFSWACFYGQSELVKFLVEETRHFELSEETRAHGVTVAGLGEHDDIVHYLEHDAPKFVNK